jgi:hypothetical protein
MSDAGASRRTFLVAGGAAATSLAIGDAFGRLITVPEAAAGEVSGTVRLTEASDPARAGARPRPARHQRPQHPLVIACGRRPGAAADGPVRRAGAPDLVSAGATGSHSSSYLGGTFHIWSIRPDGSGLRQLTACGYDDREPAYSPDGGRIAFASDRGGAYDVWILDVASGALRRLTHAAERTSDFQPAWSPDGTRIAYVEATVDDPADGGRPLRAPRYGRRAFRPSPPSRTRSRGASRTAASSSGTSAGARSSGSSRST